VNSTLLPRLEAWGLRVIIDHKNFLPGLPFASTVQDLLRSSRRVVFVCTKDFIKSEWCRKEIEAVRAEDPASLIRKAVPIILARGSVPDLLVDTMWCNLSRNRYDQNEWRNLCQSLQGVWIDDYEEVQALIRSAIQAEFQAYKSLPLIEYNNLKKYFSDESKAYKRIKNILIRHSDKGWIISNPNNPSEVKLLDILVNQTSSKEYRVDTTEYWYLRWYSTLENKYRLIYNEKNNQRYVVKKDGNAFTIEANIYPKPLRRIWRFMEYNLRKYSGFL